MKTAIEQALSISPFDMGGFYSAVWPLIYKERPHSADLLEKHLNAIRPNLFPKVIQAILRKSFLIAAVTTKGGAAKIKVRWQDELQESQRYTLFEGCFSIANDLLDELAESWLDLPQNREIISLIDQYSILPYEMPIDYRQRVAFDNHTDTIHRVGNMGWCRDPELLDLYKLRQALRDPAINPDAAFFHGPFKSKMVSLAYLTGRAQVGAFKTNRELRWEAHPRSPQFAVYSACARIEHKLVRQVCDFEDFPTMTRQWLQAHGIVGELKETYTDPITLEPYNYLAFKNDVKYPKHGSGYFQLGHMVPLNSKNVDAIAFGHSAPNVSWITADGNRIQGKSSIADIQSLLISIAKRYEQKGLIPPQEL